VCLGEEDDRVAFSGVVVQDEYMEPKRLFHMNVEAKRLFPMKKPEERRL
jgi:hypothetical protein